MNGWNYVTESERRKTSSDIHWSSPMSPDSVLVETAIKSLRGGNMPAFSSNLSLMDNVLYAIRRDVISPIISHHVPKLRAMVQVA
ncbi:hypothetical protein TNCT_40591 [Trichonephila clavata]|uniref:Uncharacterized protein n=1 Tax=Trichonephila clavata TaxID=2740835 RepID=A0A8X6HGC2_TRICU|nr:hypothetical protein TNCT_40591 [Trichonephila clavata]